MSLTLTSVLVPVAAVDFVLITVVDAAFSLVVNIAAVGVTVVVGCGGDNLMVVNVAFFN